MNPPVCVHFRAIMKSTLYVITKKLVFECVKKLRIFYLTVPVSRSESRLTPLSTEAAEAEAANEANRQRAARNNMLFLFIDKPHFI